MYVRLVLGLLCVLAGGMPASALGDDFRVDNRVYANGQTKPESRSTTIFSGGIVYDYLEEPAEVIVFEKAAGRFVLLSVGRQVRAELTTDEVSAFNARLKQRATSHSDPLIAFLGDPKFVEQFDPPAGRLTLNSPVMTYEVLLVSAGGPSVAEQYREFSDGYAQLNTVLNPGSRPPFARLALDEAMARRQSLAREVKLTVRQQQPAGIRRTTVRSEHDLVLKLGADDLKRVAKTRDQMRTFKPVKFEEYSKDIQR
jgi:hypothetical protein